MSVTGSSLILVAAIVCPQGEPESRRCEPHVWLAPFYAERTIGTECDFFAGTYARKLTEGLPSRWQAYGAACEQVLPFGSQEGMAH